MPNDCDNYVTIYAPAETIKLFTEKGANFADLVQPLTPGDLRIYDWHLDQTGQEAIQFRFISAWEPPRKLFTAMMDTLPIKFLKVSWSVEDGIAGIWVARRADDSNDYEPKELYWDEGCIEEKYYRWRREVGQDN